MDKFCGKCGKEIGAGDEFCGKCGKKLDTNKNEGTDSLEEVRHNADRKPQPIGGPIKHVGTCFKKYANASGRARRAEYWYFQLFSLVGLFTASVFDLIFFPSYVTANGGTGPLYVVFVIGVLLPSIAVGVRRLHDTGRSGWTLLLGLIPLLGALLLFIFTVTDGDDKENEYGPNPKLVS